MRPEKKRDDKDTVFPVGHEKAGKLADFRDKSTEGAITEEDMVEYLNWLVSQG